MKTNYPREEIGFVAPRTWKDWAFSLSQGLLISLACISFAVGEAVNFFGPHAIGPVVSPQVEELWALGVLLLLPAFFLMHMNYLYRKRQRKEVKEARNMPPLDLLLP